MENMDKAVVVLAASGLTEKLQKQIESILKLEVSEVLPLVDSIRGEFGPDTAEQFSSHIAAVFTQLKEVLTASLVEIGEAVDGISAPNDMAAYEEPTDSNSEQPAEEVPVDAATANAGEPSAPDEQGSIDDLAPLEPSLGREEKMAESFKIATNPDAYVIECIKTFSRSMPIMEAIGKTAKVLDIDKVDVVQIAEAFVKKKV